MKTLIATLIATAAGASFAIAPASAQNKDADAHRAAMDKAAADYRTAQNKCDAQTGNAKDVCEEQAKVARAKAEAAAVAKHDDTGNNLQQARSRVIAAEYDLAEEKCDALDGQAKDRCQTQARSTRDAALAKVEGRSGDRAVGASAAGATSGGLVQRIENSDGARADAVAKCEQMTGNARTACLVDHQGNVTTAGAAASGAGAAIAENTRAAASNVAQETREVARTAADKTREMASTVAEKTGMAGAGERTREAVATVKEKTAAAVDRTKEMASNAARKTENTVDRAGERTARAASDSAITTKVKAGLVAEPDLSGMEIAVDTEQGVVMLSGFVESKSEADRAVQVAKSVEGVTSVKSAIKVK